MFFALSGMAARVDYEVNNWPSIIFSFESIGPSFFAVVPDLTRCRLLVHVPRSSNEQCVVGIHYQVKIYLPKTFSFVLIDASSSEVAVDFAMSIVSTCVKITAVLVQEEQYQ